MQIVFSYVDYRDEVESILSQLYRNGKLLFQNRVKNYLIVAQDNVTAR